MSTGFRVRWTLEERSHIRNESIELFCSGSWRTTLFDAILKVVSELPESRRRKITGSMQVFWVHPAYDLKESAPKATRETSDVLAVFFLPKYRQVDGGASIAEYISHPFTKRIGYDAWMRDVCQPRRAVATTEKTDCSDDSAYRCLDYGVETNGATSMRDESIHESYGVRDSDGSLPTPSSESSGFDNAETDAEFDYIDVRVKIPKSENTDVGAKLDQLLEAVLESNAIAKRSVELLEALPDKLSAAISTLSLNRVHPIDAVNSRSSDKSVAYSDTGYEPSVTVETAKLKKPDILIVGLLPQQAQEIRSSFGEVFDLRFLESHSSNVDQLAKNADQIYGNTKFMKHAMDGVLRKIGENRYIRFSGSTSKLKGLLRRHNSAYLGLEL